MPRPGSKRSVAPPCRRAAGPLRIVRRSSPCRAGSARRTGRRRNARPAARRGHWLDRDRASRRCRNRSTPVPKRVNGRLTDRRPAAAVASLKNLPSLRNNESDSPSRFTTSRSSSPSSSTSLASTPMPDLAVPSSSTAVPITSARSSKRPWPWLIHNWFGHRVVGDEQVRLAVAVDIRRRRCRARCRTPRADPRPATRP